MARLFIVRLFGNIEGKELLIHKISETIECRVLRAYSDERDPLEKISELDLMEYDNYIIDDNDPRDQNKVVLGSITLSIATALHQHTMSNMIIIPLGVLHLMM